MSPSDCGGVNWSMPSTFRRVSQLKAARFPSRQPEHRKIVFVHQPIVTVSSQGNLPDNDPSDFQE